MCYYWAMRRSPLSHPLAVLRTQIGLTQKQMGELVNRAARTIQSIELGKLPLSAELALRIAEATGVDEAWLFKGDPEVSPRKGLTLTQAGRGYGPYTRADYEFHRAYLEAPLVTKEEVQAAIEQAKAEGKEEIEVSLAGLSKSKVFKQQSEIIEAIDRDLELRLKLILGLTAMSQEMRVVRWKLRRSFGDIVREFGLDVPEEGLTIAHLELADRALMAEALEAKTARGKAQEPVRAAGD